MKQFKFPWPPTMNTLWATVRGRRVLTRAGRDYKQQVRAIVGVVEETFSGDVSVQITLTLPDRRRRDIDNILKILLDSLTYAGVYKDDSQITTLLVIKGNVESPGYAVVEVKKERRGLRDLVMFWLK